PPPPRGLRVHKLVDQPRLAPPRLAYHGDYLAVAGARTCQSLPQGVELRPPADKLRQPPSRRGLEAAPKRRDTRQLEHLHRLVQPSDGEGPQGIDLYQAVDQPERRCRQPD